MGRAGVGVLFWTVVRVGGVMGSERLGVKVVGLSVRDRGVVGSGGAVGRGDGEGQWL